MKQQSAYYVTVKTIAFVVDFIVLNMLLYAVFEWKGELVPQNFKTHPKVVYLIANASMLVVQLIVPTCLVKRRATLWNVLWRNVKVILLCCVMMFLVLRYILGSGGVFEFMIYFTTHIYIFSVLVHLMELNVLRLYRIAGGNMRSVVLVGNDMANKLLYQMLVQDPGNGYKVLGYYSNMKFVRTPAELRYLGDMACCRKMMENYMASVDANNHSGKQNMAHNFVGLAEEIFVCLPTDAQKDVAALLDFCDHTGKRFYYVPHLLEGFRHNLKLEMIGGLYTFTRYDEPLNRPFSRVTKRLFDILVSGVVCTVLLPFIPIIGWIIKLQSPGPIFFAQERTGKNGRSFRCLKFRSMHVNIDADKLQATKDDPRKFAFGNFMRKTNLDEFPQFFNVLKGDMSIVGPRPHMVAHTEMYSKKIDQYMVRCFAKPGITGWAQVTGARGETKELWQMERRVRRDIWYIENWSWWLDIKIMLLTAYSIIRPGKNAY